VWFWRQGRGSEPPAARPGERIINATEPGQTDPPDPWERPLDLRLLPSLQGEGIRSHPYRPLTLRDVPPAAVEDLRPAVGELVAERLFDLPSSRRTVDPGGNRWVTTPTRVIGVGADSPVLFGRRRHGLCDVGQTLCELRSARRVAPGQEQVVGARSRVVHLG
jgi:hypothetical protein